MIKFKLIDTAQGNINLEANVNEWLAQNQNIEIISTNLVFDEDDLVYTIMYKENISGIDVLQALKK